ncbi:hypothetical protein ACFLW8_06185 [Chloroflexota bacterium]
MKKYLIPILAVLILGSSIVGCGNSERDEAVAFYKGAYPIAKEIRDISDEWNAFLKTESRANPLIVISVCQKYRARLELLQQDLSYLYAPAPIRQLKNNLALAISTEIEAFLLGESCARVPEFASCNKADEKILELNRLIMVLADEWADGLSHYRIKPSEILPKS